MANEYSILNELRRNPQQALNEAVRTRLYEGTPAGRDAFYNDLTAPFEQTPNGGSRLTPRQRQLVELARGHYESIADNRLGQKRLGAGIALAAAALGLTLLISNAKPSDNFIKQRQNNYQTANERHRYFTGSDAPWYNSKQTLEQNLEDVKTDAQKDRKGGEGLFYFLGGLGLLASLLGYTAYRIRLNSAGTPPAGAPAAGTPPAPAGATPTPTTPAPQPTPEEYLLEQARAGNVQARRMLMAYYERINRRRRRRP
jgi:hypothetical protein